VDAEGGTLSSTGLYWTDKEGKITISGISGTVVVTEVETIPGYTIDENSRTQTVVVNPNDTQTLYFYNTPVGGLQIIKSDKDSGKRIAGVKFEIRKMNGEIIGTYTTDSDGVIYLPEAESGWYTVTELEAASGYLLDTTQHRIEVKDGQTATLEITNRKACSILIHKVDANTGDGIYGVTFVIYDSGRNPIMEVTTDQDGYAYVDKELAAGKYYIRELEAADGYILDKQYKTVYVEAGKTSTIEWENTAVTGQIQITKYAAESNAITSMRFRQRRERRYTTCCCPLSKNISFPYFGRSDISDRVSSARLQRSITGRRGSRFLSTAWTLCCVNCELEQILCGFRKT